MALQTYEAIYHNGQMNWLGACPNVKKAKVIVTVLEVKDDSSSPAQRKPSARIAGKGRILGDIMSPAAPIEDWDCAK